MEADPAERIRLKGRWLNAAFFDSAMRGALGDARVLKARASRERLFGLSGSRLRKFRLVLSDGRTLDVVAKASHTGLENEALFYQRLGPQLPLRIPRLYGTGRNPQRGIETPPILILEALSPANGKGSLGPDSLRMALREIARLHARFWDDGSLSCHDFLADATVSNPAVFRRRFEFGLASILRRQRLRYFPRCIPDRTKTLIEHLASDLEPILKPLRALPATLLHGDLNPANMLVLSESRSVGTICFIDWQVVCRGPAILDLTYLFQMTRFRGTDRLGRGLFREPILEWDEFTACYFDALERELGGPVNREAHLAAAPAADIAFALRFWIPFTGILLEFFNADFLWGKMGWLFQPVLRWARIDRLLNHLLELPLARLEPNARALGLAPHGAP